jgi:hypothetical protein
MGPDDSERPHVNLNRKIMEVVSRDFEPFEAIVSKVSRGRDNDATDEVLTGLRVLLDNGLVGAYLIHADPPYATPVDPEPNSMHRFWYTVTARGKSCL